MSCDAVVAALNATVASLEAQLEAQPPAAPNPCLTPPVPYSADFHVAAVFVILACSTFGLCASLAGKYGAQRAAWLRMPGYALCVGKTIGTGILLACALVHLLQPAAQALTSACVPYEFNTDYQAYAFLYCMLAFLFMQVLTNLLTPAPAALCVACGADAEAPSLGRCGSDDDDALEAGSREDSGAPAKPAVAAAAVAAVAAGGSTAGRDGNEAQRRAVSILDALTAEIAFDCHSIIIGLTTGVAGNAVVHVLVTALAFHQCFEGVALGARLAEAGFRRNVDIALGAVFCLAAPVGIAVGIAAVKGSGLAVNGQTFLLTQGTLDGFTSGILLHIAAAKLIVDFPNDLDTFSLGTARPALRRCGLYLSLSLGAGFMAYIGKYL